MAYNTTPFHGKVCRVEKNNVAMDYSKGWSLNVNLDMADSSRVGQDWKEALPGQAGWSGSFEAYFVAGNTEQKAFFDNLVAATPGTKLTDVKFLLDASTNAFTGNIYITGVSINATMGGVVSATINFQGDGALTLTDTA
jgi:predicted secreted protein